jgi:hypothetical protein
MQHCMTNSRLQSQRLIGLTHLGHMGHRLRFDLPECRAAAGAPCRFSFPVLRCVGRPLEARHSCRRFRRLPWVDTLREASTSIDSEVYNRI